MSDQWDEGRFSRPLAFARTALDELEALPMPRGFQDRPTLTLVGESGNVETAAPPPERLAVVIEFPRRA